MTTSPFTIYTTRPSCDGITLSLPDPANAASGEEGEEGDPPCVVHEVVAAGEGEEGLAPCRWATTWVQGRVESWPCNSYGDTVNDAATSRASEETPNH